MGHHLRFERLPRRTKRLCRRTLTLWIIFSARGTA